MIGKPEDRRIFKELMQSLRVPEDASRPVGDLAVAVGSFFLGSPYAAGTLEGRGSERLVVNLRRFDCFTFLETIIILARIIVTGGGPFSSYAAALEGIRYRGGQVSGYASRLHYFSDWLSDNQRKGILKDITGAIGGRPLPGALNYMTRHSGDYPALNRKEVYREMRVVERRCSRRRRFHIPKQELPAAEPGIRDGDLIGITTAIEGLDVVHAGLAVRVRGRIHLLHASSAAARVVVSVETLSRYLAADKTRTGIMVGRIISPP